MKFNAAAHVHDYDGTLIKEADKVMTLGQYAIRALNVVGEADKPEEKVQRFATSVTLQHALSNGGIAELTVEQAAEIKTMVGKFYGPLVVGRLNEAIEGISSR